MTEETKNADQSKVFPELTNEEAALGAVKTYLMMTSKAIFDQIGREVLLYHERLKPINPAYCKECGVLCQPCLETIDGQDVITSNCCDAETSTTWDLKGPEWVWEGDEGAEK